MRDLSLSLSLSLALALALAPNIYVRRYIMERKFDQVLQMHEVTGTELVDTGVYMGPSRPAEFLQRWLNAFDGQNRYQVLADGGSITITSAAANATPEQLLALRSREMEFKERMQVLGFQQERDLRTFGLDEKRALISC